MLSFITKSNLLESRKGEIKTEREWRAQCDKEYAELGAEWEIKDKWGRFSRLLQLQPVGTDREWHGRKLTGWSE
jgi:hypothetical protein